MDGNDVTRRTLLGGIALAGSVGALGGAGTGAVLSDRERFENRIAAGTLDLLVEWDEGESSDGAVPLAIDLSNDDRSGEELFTVSLPDPGSNNPAYAWLGATCPDASELTDSLELTLSYADCGDGEAIGEPIVSGTLLDVGDELASGLVLDANRTDADAGSQACLDPGERLCLLLEWELADDYAGDETTSFEFRFVGQQCRHRDGTANPFPARAECDDPPEDSLEDRHGVSYVEIWTCDEADPVGKLELDDGYCGVEGIGENHIEPERTYDLYEDDDCEDSGYDVYVTETETNDDGDVIGLGFELLEDGGEDGSDLCRVDIKGGADVETYGEDDLETNATDGVLYAPKRTRGGNDD